MRKCPVCGRMVERSDMSFTKDCHGITMRLVCDKCYEKIMWHGKGYDGAYYSEADEFIGDLSMSEAEFDAWGY